MTTSWRVFGKHETELRKFGRKKPPCVVPYAAYFTMWTGYIEGQFCIANKRLFFSFLKKTDSKTFETILTIIELSRGVINILFSEQCF